MKGLHTKPHPTVVSGYKIIAVAAGMGGLGVLDVSSETSQVTGVKRRECL